ncbi:MAG: AI-2E family transporter [Myxococcales bacterium]|nr:MAG: AI-2E family transporter [Myxococcales bacterium]
MDETPRREIALPKAFYVVLGVLATGYVLYWLRSVLTPLFLAFAIAYVLDPVIDRFEAWKFPRPAGIAVVLVGLLGFVAAFVALVLPVVASDVMSVARELPTKIQALIASADPWLTAHGVKVPHTTTEWMERLGANANQLATSVLAPAGGILSAVLAGGFSMAGSVVAALVVPVLSVYFLNDFDRITESIRKHLPRRYRAVVTEYAREIDRALSHFVRGQLTVMAIMAVLYGTAYSILGVRLALPIGIISGTLSFIPYLGSAFALISGVLMSLLGGFNPGQLVGVVIAYAIVQTLEGFVIAPRVMGKTVGIADMWILIALFVGGEIFGFLGILLAVPAAAVIKIFLARAVDLYHESELYLDGPASLRSIVPPPPAHSSSIPPSQPPPAPWTMTPAPVAPSAPAASAGPPSRPTLAPSATATAAAPAAPSATDTPAELFKTPLTGSVIPPKRED